MSFSTYLILMLSSFALAFCCALKLEEPGCVSFWPEALLIFSCVVMTASSIHLIFL